MDVTSLNLRYGSYLIELTPWKLPNGTYVMEVTSCNVQHGSYLMELTPWKLPPGR